MHFSPVPPEEMAFALALFVSAANGQLLTQPQTQPAQCDDQGCREQFDTLCSGATFDGIPNAADIPGQMTHYSAFRALWCEYAGDGRRSSLCARVLSFHFLMLDTRGAIVQDWLVPCPGSPEFVLLHPGLVDAVATIPLQSDSQWHKNSFRDAAAPYIALHPAVTQPNLSPSILSPVATYVPKVGSPLNAPEVNLNAGPDAHQLAKAVLTSDVVARGAADAGLSTNEFVYGVLRGPLKSFIGTMGFRYLLERALKLAQRDSTELEPVTISPAGILLDFDKVSTQGAATLIAHLILLAAALVGPEMSIRLFHRFWPGVSVD